MSSNLEALIRDLKRNLVGPDHSPELKGNALEIDLDAPVVKVPAGGTYVDKAGNEVLSRWRPSRLYGVGILFAPTVDEILQGEDLDEEEETDDLSLDEFEEGVPAAADKYMQPVRSDEVDPDEPPAHQRVARATRPTTMGISFLCHPAPGDTFTVQVSGGRYRYHSIDPERIRMERESTGRTRPMRFYQRVPIAKTIELPISEQFAEEPIIKRIDTGGENGRSLKLEVRVIMRKHGKDRLFTVTLINRSDDDKQVQDDLHLFQAEFSCGFMHGETVVSRIVPYPDAAVACKSEEDELMDLLYREKQQFATGHGCAADWKAPGVYAETVVATCLPVYWIDHLSPDVVGLDFRMSDLMSDSWKEPLEHLVASYGRHVKRLSSAELPERFHLAARRNIDACSEAHKRMRRGLELLDKRADILKAFQLTNRVMRLQQLASRLKLREAVRLNQDNVCEFDGACCNPDELVISSEREPKWRAFQITLLLANLEGLTNPSSADRETVDLIWFPTGGGKTEAYLGLIAFLLCFESVTDSEATPGIRVLMRYTLRLLTAQQFERAASLVCALNVVLHPKTPDKVSLGIFVGGDTTPNRLKGSNEDQGAREVYNELLKGSRQPRKSLFVHSQCPWCGAEVGKRLVINEKASAGRRGRTQNDGRPKDSRHTRRCATFIYV